MSTIFNLKSWISNESREILWGKTKLGFQVRKLIRDITQMSTILNVKSLISTSRTLADINVNLITLFSVIDLHRSDQLL
jgi:hypothetical protein